MKIYKYLKALVINFKSGFTGHICYLKQLDRYIVFCNKCGEYICRDGHCSNPFCPERIYDD